jgi:hypothetical protein
MRPFFSFLVAASLLIHAMLGCCCHHAHAEADCDDSWPSLAAESDCCNDHANTPDGHTSDGPCKDHSHCRGLCNYLPVQKTQIGKGLSLVPSDVVAVDPVARVSQRADHIFIARTCELAPEPPVRLHLFHQILLI